MKTKSKHDLINQLRRIEKIFYSIPDWINDEHYPYMRQMNLAQAIAEDYHNNINNYLGDYPIDDAEEFYRRYDLQIPISVYAAHHSEYTKYLTDKSQQLWKKKFL